MSGSVLRLPAAVTGVVTREFPHVFRELHGLGVGMNDGELRSGLARLRQVTFCTSCVVRKNVVHGIGCPSKPATAVASRSIALLLETLGSDTAPGVTTAQFPPGAAL
jgi:hypothetical protein